MEFFEVWSNQVSFLFIPQVSTVSKAPESHEVQEGKGMSFKWLPVVG
jgi:hypothetical protein